MMDEDKTNEAATLYEELICDRKLTSTIAQEFGLEYLQSTMPDSTITPRPMSEIGWKVGELSVKEMFNMVRNAKDYMGGRFDFEAEYFVGDIDELKSLYGKDMRHYMLCLMIDGYVDKADFYNWCIATNRVDRPWMERNRPTSKMSILFLTDAEVSVLGSVVPEAYFKEKHMIKGDNSDEYHKRNTKLLCEIETKIHSLLPF